MFFSTKIKGNHHLQGDVQVYNVRIPVVGFQKKECPTLWRLKGNRRKLVGSKREWSVQKLLGFQKGNAHKFLGFKEDECPTVCPMEIHRARMASQ